MQRFNERVVYSSSLILAIVGFCAISLNGCKDPSSGDRLTGTDSLRVARLIVSPSASRLRVGDTVRFIASGVDLAGRPAVLRALQWTVIPATFATISPTGLLTALRPGALRVVAQLDQLTDSVAVEIGTSQATSIVVAPAEASLSIGDSIQLSAVLKGATGASIEASAIAWRSTDTSRVFVNQRGMAFAKRSGVAAIFAASNALQGAASLAVGGANSVPVSIDTSVFGAAVVSLQTATESHIPLRNGAGVASLSTESPQFVFGVDATGDVRALAISNVVEHRVTIRRMDAVSTALGLMFASNRVGSFAPGATDSILKRLVALSSFQSLVSYVSANAPSQSLLKLATDASFRSLVHSVISDYAGPPSPRVQAGVSRMQSVCSGSFSVTQAFPEFTSSDLTFANSSFRFISIWQRDLDANGNEIRVVRLAESMAGRKVVSVSSMLGSFLDWTLGRGNTVLAPTELTQRIEVLASAPAISELWVVGVGRSLGAPPPTSITASPFDNLAATLEAYVLEPILAPIGVFGDTELQRTIVENISALSEVTALAEAIRSGDPGTLTVRFSYAVKAIAGLLVSNDAVKAKLAAALVRVGISHGQQITVSAATALVANVAKPVEIFLTAVDLGLLVGDLTQEPRFYVCTIAPASMIVTVLSGNSQSAAAGLYLPDPLVVRVFDSIDGRPRPGVSVFFSSPSGGLFSDAATPESAIAGNPSLTDASGRARVYWRVARESGMQTAVASVPFASRSPARFEALAATAGAAAAPTLTNITPPTMVASTTALTTLTVTGNNFSTSGGSLEFTDPAGAPFSSTAHPERIGPVTATQWTYQVNNGGTVGVWQVRVKNANGQTSNAGTFTVR